jgi:hypothetical protein
MVNGRSINFFCWMREKSKERKQVEIVIKPMNFNFPNDRKIGEKMSYIGDLATYISSLLPIKKKIK